MSVYSLGAVPAAWVCTFLRTAERAFMDDVVVTYCDKQVSVPKEVAEFLEQDRKREQAQDKKDKRHLSMVKLESVPLHLFPVTCSAEDDALRNLQLENLRNAVKKLDSQDQTLISLRYQKELTMEEIGKVFDISKMAVSKRLKKLHKELRGSVT